MGPRPPEARAVTTHDLIEYCRTSSRAERSYAAITVGIFFLLVTVIVLSILIHR